jgi:hypothetical protein
MDTVSIVLVGIGGQGTVTASDILANAAFRAGRDVKKAEVHGMSQRGGSVRTDVRFGSTVLSPITPAASADVVLSMDASQDAAAGPLLRPGPRERKTRLAAAVGPCYAPHHGYKLHVLPWAAVPAARRFSPGRRRLCRRGA